MEPKKAISTVISVVALIVVVTGLVFAWYTWKNNYISSSPIDFIVEGAEVKYNLIQSNNKNLFDMDSKNKASVITINFENVKDLYANFELKINELADELLDAVFSYEFTTLIDNSEQIISSGNISNKKKNDVINLALNQKIANTYKLYIWLNNTNSTSKLYSKNSNYSFTLYTKVIKV